METPSQISFHPEVPERYQRLALEVEARLPEGWDEYVVVSV